MKEDVIAIDKTLSIAIPELYSATRYHYVAWAKIDDKVFFGDTLSFVTSSPSLVITTTAATDITCCSATLNATYDISELNPHNYTRFGFRFGKDSNHLETRITMNPSGDQLSATINDLEPATWYYYQPYVTVDGTEEYTGGVMSFETHRSFVNNMTVSINERINGIRIHIEGIREDPNLKLTILRSNNTSDFSKEPAQINWSSIKSYEGNLYRNDYPVYPESGEAIFGAFLTDKWGNCSDTVARVLSPVQYYEAPADKELFSDACLPDDNCKSYNSKNYPIENLWDGTGSSSYYGGKYWFFASEETSPSPCWLTIDLGQEVVLSAIEVIPRMNHIIYGGGAVRDYEFWGSLSPTGHLQDVSEQNPFGFDYSWFCLGRFTQEKPSGYLENGLPGIIISEDFQAYNSGNHFELNSVNYPRCYDRLRYLRVVFLKSFRLYEYPDDTNHCVWTGEITPIEVRDF